MEKSELYLRRLRKHYNQLRKVHHIKDEDELDVIANLTVTYQLLAKRIAQEAKIFALEVPIETMSHQEKLEHRARSRDIFDMFNMASKSRDLARQMVQDHADENLSSNGNTDANQSIIEDAKKALEDIQVGFQLDDEILGVIECETIKQQTN